MCSISTQVCACADGRTGQQSVCQGQAPSACDCSQCPAYQPSSSPAFTACGGEPFGLWFSENLQPQPTVKIGPNNCQLRDAIFMVQSSTPALMLDLQSGGAAAFSLTPPELDFGVQAQCAGLDPTGHQCANLNSTNGSATCTDAGCGVCQCATTAKSFTVGSANYLSASWTRSNTSFTVSGPGVQFTASYCVQGDTMTLQDSSGTVYSMRRAYVGGTPTACSTRTAATCVDGCGLGRCQGGASCTAGSMGACLAIQGCSWSDTTCVGTPPQSCDWTSTDPGCLVLAYRGECAGIQRGCETYLTAECASVPGCTPKSQCQGGAITCAGISQATCGSTFGCIYLSSCEQNPPYAATCPNQSSASVCTGANCQWVECVGTPEPCQAFTAAECSSHPGCQPIPVEAGGASDAQPSEGSASAADAAGQ